MLIAVFIALAICIGLLGLICLHLFRNPSKDDGMLQFDLEKQAHDKTQGKLDEVTKQAEELKIENAKLQRDLEHAKTSATEKLQMLEKAEARLKTDFENLANQIFSKHEKNGAELQSSRMTAVLEPFKQQIDAFRKRVEDVHRSETEQSGRLIEQVRQLQSLSTRVSEDANQLALAIKGDAKKQGDWGEVIVERMLEVSGLTLDREYSRQVSERSEDGNLQRPDFVLHLPGSKAVILDAKVSLTAYERYCRAQTEEERQQALKEHIASVRKHVTDLQKRGYDAILGNRSLDFVIMCIPIEPAYQAALQADPDLLYMQAQAPVVITGPSTLMITLKLIAQIWRRENENRNAEKIADRAGRMHDQIVLIYEALADAQKKLGGTSDALEIAMKRVKDGRGSLLGKADELKLLGAKVSKSLPVEILDGDQNI